MNTTAILPFLQTILAIANICVLAYAFKNFLRKPHDTLEQRVDKCEQDIKDMKQSLFRGDGKFREQERALTVLIRATMALIEFEIQYCLTENKAPTKGLEKAKEALDEFISDNERRTYETDQR